MNFKKKIYSFLSISILLCLGLIVFVILPLSQEIRDTSENLLIQKQALSSLENRTENLKEFKIIYQKIQTDIEKIENLFVDEKMPVEFIDFLEKKADDCYISMDVSLSSLKKNKEESWSFLVFQIDSIGSLSGISRFLEKMETSPYLIEVQNFKLRKLSEAETRAEEIDPDDFRANFSIKVPVK